MSRHLSLQPSFTSCSCYKAAKPLGKQFLRLHQRWRQSRYLTLHINTGQLRATVGGGRWEEPPGWWFYDDGCRWVSSLLTPCENKTLQATQTGNQSSAWTQLCVLAPPAFSLNHNLSKHFPPQKPPLKQINQEEVWGHLRLNHAWNFGPVYFMRFWHFPLQMQQTKNQQMKK